MNVPRNNAIRKTMDGFHYNEQDYYKKPPQQRRMGGEESDEESDGNEVERGYMKLFTKNKNTSRPNQLLMCVTCGNTFTKLCNVMDHIRMHRGLRPFMCKYCNQSFAQKGNRDRHQKKNVCFKDRKPQNSNNEKDLNSNDKTQTEKIE